MTPPKREWRIIRYLRWITRSLILLLIAFFSALVAMRFAIHGREARVPNVKGLSLAQAQETANRVGLTIFVEDKFYSSYVPEGSIVSQIPVANSRVRRGGRIRVAESIGPLRVAIPDLVGQTQLAATLNLRRRGLDAVTIQGIAVPSLSPDRVISQVPAAGATEFTSPKVSLLLAQPPKAAEFVMPNFVGRSLAEARDKIARAGLEPATVSMVTVRTPSPDENSSDTTPGQSPPVFHVPSSGTITYQSPPAGSRVNSDSQIRLSVIQ